MKVKYRMLYNELTDQYKVQGKSNIFVGWCDLGITVKGTFTVAYYRSKEEAEGELGKVLLANERNNKENWKEIE